MSNENTGHDDSAAVLLRSMEDGAFYDDFGREVRAAIVKLKQHAADTNARKKGVLTLKLTLTHDPKDVLESEAEIAVKLPKVKRPTSIHFTSEDGDITNRRPERQITIEAVQGGKTDPAKARPTNIKAV